MSSGTGRATPGRRSLALLVVVAATAGSGPARALSWPDAGERVERDLSASDVGTRRAAAKGLRSLGMARGTPLVMEALGDPDGEVRLTAADAAIRLRVSGATEVVASWLNASDTRLRKEACIVARAMPDPRAVAALARSLGDPDAEVRSAAAEALGRQRSDEAVPALLGRLDDPAPAVRITIAEALARLADERAVVPLIGKVEDSSAEVRQAVVRALGSLADVRASPALVLSLRDPNADVRREALVALGRLRATEAVDAIAPFINDRAVPLRLAAVEALGRLASPDAMRVLAAALGAGDDVATAQQATPLRQALVEAGDRAVPLLKTILEGSPAPSAATSAAWVLGQLHARAAATTLVDATRRGSLPIASALHALAGAGTSAELPFVLEYLTDDSPVVRREAVDATRALLDPKRADGRAVEPLAAALRDPRPSPEERAQIAQALGQTGATRAGALLMTLVRASDLKLRLAAIDALALLPSPDADQLLLDALASTDPVSRPHAAVSLAEIGGARAREALLAELQVDDAMDRSCALTALGGILARRPTEAAVVQLANALELAGGPERDGILEALGRAPLASAVRALAAAATSSDPFDRAQAATLFGAQAQGPARAAAAREARTLLKDPNARVRAQATWSLGSLGELADIDRLQSLLRAGDADSAANAAAAIARLLANSAAGRARHEHTAQATRVLCPIIVDDRPLVRANALAGLALASVRCQDGNAERSLLSNDAFDVVRAAAALAVSTHSSPADVLALDRCAHSDPSGSVATRCLPSTHAAHGPARAVTVYIVPGGSEAPKPDAPYALALADGLIHVGTADRRGAIFEPEAPEGNVRLLAISPIEPH